MKGKVVGFVGVDVQDTILYLSRIFLQMGKRVLMADYSESQALFYSIPFLEGINVYTGYAEYRSTFFTCKPLSENDLLEFDVIMIFFGFCLRTEIKDCSHIIYTTDGEKNHMDKIASYRKKGSEYTQLVYRNVKNSIGMMSLETSFLAVKESCRYYRNDNKKEKKLREQCQYNDIFDFRGISSNYRNYLQKTVQAVFPEEGAGNSFALQFKKAEMGC